MRLRDVARVVCSFAVAGATAVVGVSCGGGSSSSSSGRLDGSLDGTGLTFGDSGGNHCMPQTCASQGFSCGDNTDGCGNVLHCGTCANGAQCGAGGFSKCPSPDGSTGGGMTCTPKTCADYPTGTCGAQTDGCGGATAVCGAQFDGGPLCPPGEQCGGGGPGLCGVFGADGGDASVCTPLTCASYPSGTCGAQSDGCGNLTDVCGQTVDGGPLCPAGQTCGAGGSSLCGTYDAGTPNDAGSFCTPVSCATAAYASTCGIQGDGCGGTFGPCQTCAAPGFCGGGGASLCGGDAGTSSGGDGSVGCTPKTCADYPGTCGQQSDGCGGLTANCGTCPLSQYCGGGGPSTCGGTTGKTNDGGVVSQCTPKTSANCGSANCGQFADGCGGTYTCGPASGCQAPLACGAGGTPNVCGTTTPCTGLCPAQYACDGGSATLSGTVVAGTIATYFAAGQTQGDPVPNVLVYIPNRTAAPYVDAFTPRASETQAQQCSTCGADVSGTPLVETKTKYDGTFTLTQVPVGATIPIVIQLGRWRRVFTVSVGCGSNTVNATGMPAGILRMPRTRAEGDIPLTAISTGDVDAMECVLLKMGVDSSEFAAYAPAPNTPAARIHMYQGNGATASTGTSLPETTLMGTTTGNGTYNNYDQVILPCWGVDPTTMNSTNAKSPAELANLVTYGNDGGHFFATHYSYAWLYANNPYSTTANWNVNHGSFGSTTGVVSQTVPPTTPVTNPGVFVEWLNYIKALSNPSGTATPPNPANVTIANPRHDVNSVALQSVDWIDGKDNNDNSAMLLHYTFDTPVGSSSQCGHSIFSDFHVSNSTTGVGTCQKNTDCSSDSCVGAGGACTRNNQCASGSCNNGMGGTNTCNGLCTAATFPSEANQATYCNAVPMTSQEKILEYMIWDLASCVPAPPTNTCTKKTCSDYAAGTCGPQSDGCGGLTPDCSPCPSGQLCGGCGTAGICCVPDGGTCTPKTCNDYPNSCGQQPDGCGSLTANCACLAPATCGGGGTPGLCSVPSDGGTGCQPMTCSSYPAGTCGQQADGCGGLTVDCNPCPSGQTCGGCGTPGQCCTPPKNSCTPATSCPSGQMCGFASDGCGGVVNCGTCTAPQTCGGCGQAGVCCGSNPCQPVTCQQQNVSCGPAGDGCGNLIDCGPCPTPDAGTGCTPKTCTDQGIQCGPAGDGCGNLIPTCGSCMAPATCGGGGKPGVCGTPIAM